jgi:hypothetical protein
MSRICLSAGVIALSVFFLQPAIAGPLTSAEVTKIINRVAVIDPASGERPALIRDVIKDDLGIQTAEKSRSELLFQDNTLTRLGAETFFSFKTGTRDMTLEKGSMLLQVPKGLGGAKIHTAAVTAAITGTTIMMEYIPGRYIKVLVLEGSLRLSRNGSFGDSLVLRPGKMVIMRPDAKRIPDPVDVDLKQVVKSSTLVNFPDSAPLPSTALIQAAIDVQSQNVASKNLVPTNLVIGHGTDVIVASNDQLARILDPAPAPAPANLTTGGPTTTANTDTNVASTTPSIDPVTSSVSTITSVDPIAATTQPSLTLASTVTNTAAPVVDSVVGTVAAVPLVDALSGTVSALPVLDPVVGTVTSLPVVGSVTQAITALPVVDSLTSSPVLTPIADTLSSLSTLTSLTSTVTSSPILGSLTNATASLPSLTTVARGGYCRGYYRSLAGDCFVGHGIDLVTNTELHRGHCNLLSAARLGYGNSARARHELDDNKCHLIASGGSLNLWQSGRSNQRHPHQSYDNHQ